MASRLEERPLRPLVIMRYGPLSWLATLAIALPIPFTAQAQTNFFCVNLKTGFVTKPVPQNAVMNFGATGNLCHPLGSGNVVMVNGRPIGEFGPTMGGSGGYPGGGGNPWGGYGRDQYYCINPFTRATQQGVRPRQAERLRLQGYGCMTYGELPPNFRPW